MKSAGTAPESADVRLYVFPHAGGSGLTFQSWPALLPSGWRTTALDAPGHGTLMRQPPLTDGDALVDHFLERLGPELEHADSPFAFFGHSMGALVAYELTRRLSAAGRATPVWLGLSACGAPRPDASVVPVRADGLSDEELRRRVALLGGTPSKVLDHPGLWRHFAPVIRADLRLVESWRPAPADVPLPVPVSVFGGARDQAVGLDGLARWADHVERVLAVHVFPGGHFYFQDGLDALVDALVTDVDTALRSRPAALPAR